MTWKKLILCISIFILYYEKEKKKKKKRKNVLKTNCRHGEKMWLNIQIKQQQGCCS